MATKNSKKDEPTVDTAADVTETQAPTKSLFAGAKTPGASVAQDAPETATEASAEAVTETATDEAAEQAPGDQEAIAETVAPNEPSELDDLSVEELRQREAEIKRRLDEKTNAEKKGILDQVVQVIGEYGITTEEVVTALGGYKAKRTGTPAKVKFRDPATGAEWSGRGKEPLWIRGKDRAQFAVPEEAAPVT